MNSPDNISNMMKNLLYILILSFLVISCKDDEETKPALTVADGQYVLYRMDVMDINNNFIGTSYFNPDSATYVNFHQGQRVTIFSSLDSKCHNPQISDVIVENVIDSIVFISPINQVIIYGSKQVSFPHRYREYYQAPVQNITCTL